MGCGPSNTAEKERLSSNDQALAVPVVDSGPGAAASTNPTGAKVIESWPHKVRFLFIRHAHAQLSKDRVGPEKKDPRLSDMGEDQAKKLARRLQSMCEGGLEVVCSPMARCIRTALPVVEGGGRQIVAGRRRVCHAALCEHGNDPKDFSSKGIAEAYPALFRPPGGEEVKFVGFDSKEVDTRDRAASIARWLCEECSSRPEWQMFPVAVFSHQTFLDCLLQTIVLGDSSKWEYGSTRFSFANTAISEVIVGPDGVTMPRDNDSSHLR